MKKIILLFVVLSASSFLLNAQTTPPEKVLAEKPGYYVLSSEALRDMLKNEKPDVTKIYGKGCQSLCRPSREACKLFPRRARKMENRREFSRLQNSIRG